MPEKIQIKNPEVLTNIKQTLATAEAVAIKFNKLVEALSCQIREMETGENLAKPKRKDWSHVRSWGKKL